MFGWRLHFKSHFALLLVGLTVLLAACTQENERSQRTQGAYQAISSKSERYAEYDIITVLPRDAIQAIDNPRFVSAQEADERYQDDELVLGVDINGDARAYSIPLLSSHEIVNDTVGGVKITVTW